MAGFRVTTSAAQGPRCPHKGRVGHLSASRHLPMPPPPRLQVWEVPEGAHQEGLVVHTLGAPLDHATYGGGFIYHMDQRCASMLDLGPGGVLASTGSARDAAALRPFTTP